MMAFIKRVFRFISTWLFANILIALGFVRRAKEKAMRGDHILSVYFHKPSLAEFENCIKWLKKNKFTFLSPADLYIIFERRLPFPKGAVILTVDDGWQSNKINIAQVAEKHQVPVTIFVATDPVEQGTYWWSFIEEAQRRNIPTPTIQHLKTVPNEERLAIVDKLCERLYLEREAMTISQVQTISKSAWVTIGSHTASHPILNNCSDYQVFDELQQSRDKLRTWTDDDIAFFAYPNGDYTQREIQVLQELGYKMAFTVQPKYLTSDRLLLNYELPRFEVIEDASFAESVCRMVGVWEPIVYKIKYLFRKQKSTQNTNPELKNTLRHVLSH